MANSVATLFDNWVWIDSHAPGPLNKTTRRAGLAVALCGILSFDYWQAPSKSARSDKPADAAVASEAIILSLVCTALVKSRAHMTMSDGSTQAGGRRAMEDRSRSYSSCT